MAADCFYEGQGRLDGAICDGTRIQLNFSQKVVPVYEDELEDSRETATLAVHGVPLGWNAEDLLKDFPKADIGNYYSKEGTVFLKYRYTNHAIQDFIRNDNIRIQGKPLIVMFSHQRSFLRHRGRTHYYGNSRDSRREVDRSPSLDGDLRSRINNNQERKWAELIKYASFEH